jgi:hypothetical protein
MLVGRCSSQLSGHQNDERNQKSHNHRGKNVEQCGAPGGFLEGIENPLALLLMLGNRRSLGFARDDKGRVVVCRGFGGWVKGVVPVE